MKNADYRLAYLLLTIGLALWAFERFGLGQLARSGVTFDANLVSALAVAPVLFIVAGAVLFMVKRMRRR